MMAASRNKYDRLYVYMEHMKLIKAQQAKSVHWYDDTREELLQSIVAIWFKKLCTDVNLSVCYINTISCRIDYFTIFWCWSLLVRFTLWFIEFSESIPHNHKSKNVRRYFTNQSCKISNILPNTQLNSYITLSLPNGPPLAYP